MNSNGNQVMRTSFPNSIPSSNAPNASSNPPNTGSGNTSENFNTATLCNIGAETVQEILSRTIEIFKELKTIQLPNGLNSGAQITFEKKKMILENFSAIRQLSIKLRIIYDKVNNDCNGMEYTPIETLIPYKDDIESRVDLKKVSENYRHLVEDGRELREQLCLRSSYLKEIINQLRKVIWEINTMLAMKS